MVLDPLEATLGHLQAILGGLGAVLAALEAVLAGRRPVWCGSSTLSCGLLGQELRNLKSEVRKPDPTAAVVVRGAAAPLASCRCKLMRK